MSKKIKLAYEFNNDLKKNAIEDSSKIREQFSWEKIGEIGHKTIIEFYEKNKDKNEKILNNNNKDFNLVSNNINSNFNNCGKRYFLKSIIVDKFIAKGKLLFEKFEFNSLLNLIL